MRIAQVVTLLSPDGAYGGPVRVALNQLRQLQDMGHDVCLYAAYRGYDEAPTEMNGVPVRAFKARRILPKTGFAGLTSPALLRQLRKDLPTFDVAHVHLARDLVTLPSADLALRAHVPLVVQTHGMIDRSSRALAGPLDKMLTRRILRSASRVLHLTETEKDDLRQVAGPSLHLFRLINGVPAATAQAAPHDGENLEVLFMGRLQARKRPTLFALAAARLCREFPNARFTLVGPDEGEGAEVTAIIQRSGCASQITWEGALEPTATQARMSKSSIFVLPSINEPFPMSVLEAAALGLPVIVTSTCGLASFITLHDAGLVIDHSLDELIRALRLLLTDDSTRVAKGMNAIKMAQSAFSIWEVAGDLEEMYAEIQTAPH